MTKNYQNWLENKAYFVFDIMLIYFVISVYLDVQNTLLTSIWLYSMLCLRILGIFRASRNINHAINSKKLDGESRHLYNKFYTSKPWFIKFVDQLSLFASWTGYIYVAYTLGNFDLNFTILALIIYIPFLVHIYTKLPVFLNMFKTHQN